VLADERPPPGMFVSATIATTRGYRQTALYLPTYAPRLEEARALLDAWLPRTLRSEVRLSSGAASARGETVTA
jgi:hypothetical protein